MGVSGGWEGRVLVFIRCVSVVHISRLVLPHLLPSAEQALLMQVWGLDAVRSSCEHACVLCCSFDVHHCGIPLEHLDSKITEPQLKQYILTLNQQMAEAMGKILGKVRCIE